jgi:hypothetical protein
MKSMTGIEGGDRAYDMNRDADRRWRYENTGDPTRVNFQDPPVQGALERMPAATPRFGGGEPSYGAKKADLPETEAVRRAVEVTMKNLIMKHSLRKARAVGLISAFPE